MDESGYAGYDKLYTTSRVTEVACWAHFRRKIFDIHASKPTSLTTDLLARIASLYRIEDDIKSLILLENMVDALGLEPRTR